MYILEVVKCVSVERYIQTQRVLGRRGWGGRGRAWEGGGGEMGEGGRIQASPRGEVWSVAGLRDTPSLPGLGAEVARWERAARVRS